MNVLQLVLVFIFESKEVSKELVSLAIDRYFV